MTGQKKQLQDNCNKTIYNKMNCKTRHASINFFVHLFLEELFFKQFVHSILCTILVAAGMKIKIILLQEVKQQCLFSVLSLRDILVGHKK